MANELSRFSQTKGALFSSAGLLATGAMLFSKARTPEGGWIPPIITEHIGNFGLSFAPILTASVAGPFIEHFAALRGNKRLERVGRILPLLSVGGYDFTQFYL